MWWRFGGKFILATVTCLAVNFILNLVEHIFDQIQNKNILYGGNGVYLDTLVMGFMSGRAVSSMA